MQKTTGCPERKKGRGSEGECGMEKSDIRRAMLDIVYSESEKRGVVVAGVAGEVVVL
jgi:hypothetical protein